MYFQPVDKKRECNFIYYEGEFCRDHTSEMKKTWDYYSFLENKEIEYANLYCGGKNLDDVCPPSLQEDWREITKLLKAHLRTFQEAKISLDDICFYDSVPEHFLMRYCDIKSEITKHVFDSHKKPENYDFLLELTKLVENIKNQSLDINSKSLEPKLHNFKTRQFYKKISKLDNKINYKIFGTKTGRLTTDSNSFPILTLDKDHREILIPRNDLFLELDYNAAELRVFLGLLGIPQPKEDIHTWIGENVFNGKYSRDMVKKKVFAWLYNPEAVNKELEKIFNKQKVLDKYYSNGVVKTYFGRSIETDQHHALNYIIQSTTSDMFLRKVIDLNNFLKNKKSNIVFMIHDSVVIDFQGVEKKDINQIIDVFSNTKFGKLKINISAGKNYGKMRSLKF